MTSAESKSSQEEPKRDVVTEEREVPTSKSPESRTTPKPVSKKVANFPPSKSSSKETLKTDTKTATQNTSPPNNKEGGNGEGSVESKASASKVNSLASQWAAKASKAEPTPPSRVVPKRQQAKNAPKATPKTQEAKTTGKGSAKLNTEQQTNQAKLGALLAGRGPPPGQAKGDSGAKKSAALNTEQQTNQAKLGALLAGRGPPPGQAKDVNKAGGGARIATRGFSTGAKDQDQKSDGALNANQKKNQAKLGALLAGRGPPPGAPVAKKQVQPPPAKSPPTSLSPAPKLMAKVSFQSQGSGISQASVAKKSLSSRSDDSVVIIEKATVKAKDFMRRASMAGVDTIRDFRKLGAIKKAAMASAMAKEGLAWTDMGLGSDDSMNRLVVEMGEGDISPASMKKKVASARRRGSFVELPPSNLRPDEPSEDKIKKAIGADVVAKQAKMVNPLMKEMQSGAMKRVLTRMATRADGFSFSAKGKNPW